MKKTMKIDLSSDRLIAVAADLVEEHNYISALKMLNKNAERNFNDEDSYMLYAEIFDDIGLYEKSVNSWFRYIDCTLSGELSEAYEGLAVAYMNLGDEHFSAYYYNKLLLDTDEINDDERKEIISSFLSREPNPLKFVYPPKIADCSDIISDGVKHMKLGEYDKAIDEFDKIDEDNEAYLSARNYIAMCDIICDKCEEAEAECLAVLKKHPQNVQALTTLAAVKTEQKKSEESKQLARKLLTLGVTSNDDVYKIATVCCENKMHAEAYELFCKLEDELFYDSTVLYFKAVSAFNSGKYEESFSAFDKLLTIYPESVTARYHYDKAREAAENGTELELSYFYRLPQEERESSLKMLAAFSKLSATQAKKLFSLVDISGCVLWCFDEHDGSGNTELKFLASLCAVKARLDGIVADILLNAFIEDSLKVQILTMIGERNETNWFGVVICNLYKRVYFRSIETGKLKRKNFITAYSRLTAHFAIINSDYGDKFAKTAEKLYKKLEKEDRLSDASDTDALTAAIYYKSNISEPKVARRELSKFFDTTDAKIFKILGEV